MAVFLFVVLLCLVGGITALVRSYRRFCRDARADERERAERARVVAAQQAVFDAHQVALRERLTREARDRASREPELLSIGREIADNRPHEWSERAALCMCGRLEDDKACHARWCPYRTG